MQTYQTEEDTREIELRNRHMQEFSNRCGLQHQGWFRSVLNEHRRLWLSKLQAREEWLMEQVIGIVKNAGENSVGLLDPDSEDSRAFDERFISQDGLLEALAVLLTPKN